MCAGFLPVAKLFALFVLRVSMLALTLQGKQVNKVMKKYFFILCSCCCHRVLWHKIRVAE